LEGGGKKRKKYIIEEDKVTDAMSCVFIEEERDRRKIM